MARAGAAKCKWPTARHFPAPPARRSDCPFRNTNGTRSRGVPLGQFIHRPAGVPGQMISTAGCCGAYTIANGRSGPDRKQIRPTHSPDRRQISAPHPGGGPPAQNGGILNADCSWPGNHNRANAARTARKKCVHRRTEKISLICGKVLAKKIKLAPQ